MSESASSSSSFSRSPSRWAALLVAIGTTLVILSAGGLLLLPLIPLAEVPTTGKQILPTIIQRIEFPTPVDQARIDRGIVVPPTHTPPATPHGSPPWLAPPVSTIQPTSQASMQPTQTVDLTPIAWTEEEKNALSWMCFYEVGGMGAMRDDACLSVISTVRARYVYGSGLGTDVLSVLRWPGQFNIEVRTDSPHPDLFPVVERYQQGARGSCNGYFYFDSVPGGPSSCVIYGAANQFIEFHNGWS